MCVASVLGSRPRVKQFELRMRDRSSCQPEQALAREMQAIVKDAAQPVSPGETVKGQMRRAWNELRRPPFWRVRAAWWGEAGKWVASAVEDFRRRSDELRQRRQHRQRNDAATFLAQVDRLERLRQALSAADPAFYRDEIDALEHVCTHCRTAGQ